MQRIIDEPLPLRMLTVLLLIAGYFLIYRPAEEHLSAVQNATRELHDRANFGESLLARRDVYEHAAERMRRELSGIDFDADAASMMASFLDDVDARAKTHGLRVAEVSPERDASTHAASALTLHVHGGYHSIIAFINDLSTMHTLIRIDALKLTRLAGDVHAGQSPDLDAAINAALIPIHTGSSGSLQ